MLTQLRPALVLDWRKKYDKVARVKKVIAGVLDELPPTLYDETLYERLCAEVYQHVRESYDGDGRSKYTRGHT